MLFIYVHVFVSMPFFQYLNQLADLHEIWPEHYAIESHPNLMHFTFLQR
jgi:hypothetical protein